MGIRAALGASPWRLVRGLLVEGLVLSLAGAVLGVALASGGVRDPARLAAGRPAARRVDRHRPARARRRDRRRRRDRHRLRHRSGAAVGAAGSGRRAEGGRPLGDRRRRARSACAASSSSPRWRSRSILLVGAGLFTGSFVRLMRVDPGFDYHNVIALNVGLRLLPGEKFGDEFAARSAAYARPGHRGGRPRARRADGRRPSAAGFRSPAAGAARA